MIEIECVAGTRRTFEWEGERESMPTDVIMPQMGESIFEGTITKWLKKPGDTVQRDEPLFEISTDKVDAEIPSPASGVLTEVKIAEGANGPDQHRSGRDWRSRRPGSEQPAPAPAKRKLPADETRQRPKPRPRLPLRCRPQLGGASPM